MFVPNPSSFVTLFWVVTDSCHLYTHTFRCRNISVLQSCLSKITLIREKDLDRARRYYEMLYLNDEVRKRRAVSLYIIMVDIA